MLAALRTNTKVVLWIVVVAFLGFIFAAWGRGLQRSRSGPAKGMIGRVDDESIRYQDYAEALRVNLKSYAERGGEINDDIRAAIEDQTWQTMVSEILINQEIKRLGIEVSDQYVFDVLWDNPPQAIYTSPAYQDSAGNFDFNLYHNEIQLHPERWEALADYYRKTLQQQILQQEIQTAAFVNENEIWSEYVTQNQKVRVSYVAVDPAAIDATDLMPSDADARAYFEAHRAEYERPPMVSLAYVRFPKVPTAEDEQDVIARLQDLADAVRDGEDFGELAKVYSEDPSAANGGDLGYLKKGTMPPEFDEAAQTIAVGQVSQPIKTANGYYVIKVEDRRRSGGDTEVRARVIRARAQASEQTLATIEEAATRLLEQAKNGGLAQAADSLGLEVQKTQPFADGRFIPGVGSASTAVALAFQERAGFLFGPMTTGDAVYAFEIAEKSEKRLPTYDEIEQEAQAAGRANPAKLAIAAERQSERALAIATEIANATQAGKTLEDAAAASGGAVQQSPIFSRRDFVPGVGRGNEFIGASFALRIGDITGPVKTEEPVRYYIIRVEEQVTASQEGFPSQRAGIGDQLLQRKRSELLAAWMEGLTRKAKIEDYRDVYFASGGRAQEQPPTNVGYGY
jgi:peptidyl-prolyl cis-trans isomerase D